MSFIYLSYALTVVDDSQNKITNLLAERKELKSQAEKAFKYIVSAQPEQQLNIYNLRRSMYTFLSNFFSEKFRSLHARIYREQILVPGELASH